MELKNYEPEYALSLNINKLRGINTTEKGPYSFNSSLEFIAICAGFEVLSLILFPDVSVELFKLEWGVKSITTDDPRDRIATTGT